MLLTLLLACAPSAPTGPAETTAPPATEAPAPARPDMVLVVIDTLRADHVGAYGYSRPATPNLDALAAEGVLFERAYANASWTLPSFASLLTGLLPHEHRVVRDGKDTTLFGTLPATVTTLAERLQAAGYATGAVLNNTFLAPQFGLNQGFDHYDWQGAGPTNHRSATDSVSAALSWLNQQQKPAFLLVHFIEPHAAYDPPAATRGVFTSAGKAPVPVPFYYLDARPLAEDGPGVEERRTYVRGLYDEEVLAADQALGALVSGLRARPRWGQTTLVVTSDHGEEHWDHGGFEHGHSLHGEVTRVPLIAVGAVGPHRRVSTVVSLLDLHQSLVQLGGATPDPATQGADLWTLPAGVGPRRIAMSENCLYGEDLASLVDPTSRVVVHMSRGFGEAWAVDAQGQERERLQGQAQAEVGSRLIPMFKRLRPDQAPILAIAPTRIEDTETLKQLQSLGYLDARPAAE